MSENCSHGNLCRVGCDVTSCIYHSKDNCCCAESINVGSPNAVRKGETYCETFKSNTSDKTAMY